MARVEPTLPQLPSNQDGRPPPQTKPYTHDPTAGTLPHLKQGGDSLTRQTSFLQPKDINREKAMRKVDEYGNVLPMTPQGELGKQHSVVKQCTKQLPLPTHIVLLLLR